jgi:plastocyanin
VAAGGLAVVAIVVAVAASARVDAEPAQAGDVVVEVVGFHFPDVITVPAGGSALWVDNQDLIRHTLVVEGTGVHVELPASTSVRSEVDLAPGTYRYFCDVPGHEYMEGQLDVR